MRNLRYHWTQDAPIWSVKFADVDGKNKEATLFPSEDASLDDLKNARADLLQNHKMHSYPTEIDGKPALVVYGYKKPEDLVNALFQEGYVKSKPKQYEEIIEDKPEAATIGEKFDELRHSAFLPLSGITGLIGTLLNYSVALTNPDPDSEKNINWNEMGVSVIYTANSILYSLFGNGNATLKETRIIDDVQMKLLDQGILLDDSMYQTLQQKRIEDLPRQDAVAHFIKENVAQFNEFNGAIANLFMMNEGGFFNPETYLDADKRKEARVDYAAAGLASLIGSSAVVAITEKPIEKQDPSLQDNIFGKALSWVQESPTRFSGAMNMVNMVFRSKDSWDKFHKHKHDDTLAAKVHTYMPAIITSMYVASTLFTFASFQGRGKLGVKGFDELFTRVAEEVSMVKDGEQRETVINSVANVLADHDDVDNDITADKIKEVLHEKIDMLQRSPWVDTDRNPIVKQAADDDMIPSRFTHPIPVFEENKAEHDAVPEHVVNADASSHELLQEKMLAAGVSH